MQYQNATAQPRQELTDVIVEGLTDDTQFLGLKLLPPSPLQLPNGHVPKITIGKGNLMRATAKGRAPGSDFDRWQSGIDAYNIELVQVSEEVSLPDEQTLVYEDYFAFESFYAQEASNRLLRSHELDMAAAVFSTANFDSNNGAIAYAQANIGTITPVQDIITAIRLLKGRGESPNTIAFPGAIYDRVRQSADMRAWIAGSVNPGARVSEDTIAASFASMGIKQVLVSEAYVNQSQDGTTNSINPIVSLAYIFVGSVQPGELRTGGVGRTFYWAKMGPVLNISSYRDEPKASNIIRAQKTTLAAITNTRAGTLIGTQVTT